MEIRPNNNVGGVSPVGGTNPKARVSAPPADAANFSGSTALNTALQSLPDARPEVVEVGKTLVNDSSYPPPVVIKRISHLIAANVNDQTPS